MAFFEMQSSSVPIGRIRWWWVMVCYKVLPVFVVKVKVVVVVVDRRDFEIQSSVLQLERSVGGGDGVL